MNATQFAENFKEYLARIEEARASKSHHDQLRSIFLDFLTKTFNAKHEEFELEKSGIMGLRPLDKLHENV